MNKQIVSLMLSGVLALAGVGTVDAAFRANAKNGPAGDPTGEATRQQITDAIAAATGLEATLGASDPAQWPDEWRALCGTQAASEALAVVTEIRQAFASLRDNWDGLVLQTVTLKTGWNAFYVYAEDPAPAAAVINPSGYAARLHARVAKNFANPTEKGVSALLTQIKALAVEYVAVRAKLIVMFGANGAKGLTDWPASDVYVYMGATDASAQFTSKVDTEASGSTPYLTWSAAAPDALNIAVLPPGRVCTLFSTNALNTVVTFLGKGVRAASMSWHKTGGSENPAEWNFLGLALSTDRQYVSDILNNLDFTCTGQAKLKGNDPTKPDFLVAGAGDRLTVSDGDVLIASATATSTWYPAPTALPVNGVTLAAGRTEATFQLKNDTAAAQTVTGTLWRTGIRQTALDGMTGVNVRSSALTDWTRWNFSETSTTNLYFVDTLAAGETRTYTVYFQRTAFDVLAREKAYSGDFKRMFAAVMRFQYGTSKTCTYLGLRAQPDNNAVSSVWPTGLWVGTMAFDKVSQVKGNQTIVHDVPAKGTMMVRALVHVDTKGVCRLLHHVQLATVTVEDAVDGTYTQTRLYAGSAKSAVSGANVRRLDSIAMDIDHPVVIGEGSFTNGMAFAWTIAPKGRSNPFYHPYHPNHDGLAWDFETPAPSGDDVNNYREGQVKPETWSIENRVTLTLDKAVVQTLPTVATGTCTWELGNVRRTVNGENIRASGKLTLTRLNSVGTLNLE